MLDDYLGKKVIIDFQSPYVCLGTLVKYDAEFFEVKNADFHDLRDTDTSRENYIASSLVTGIKRNRRKVLVFRSDVVAITLFESFADI
ncbi:MAG: hypothetical protein R3B84_19430 [Zavarzinella sp.]